MLSIRYGLHFAALILVVLVFWLARDFYVPARISDFDFLDFALIGALHATAIVVSIRDRRSVRPFIALLFITFATIWSAETPYMVLFGSIVSIPVINAFPMLRPHLSPVLLLFLNGSLFGSLGYWLLIRQFWLKSLSRLDVLRTVLLCFAATLLSAVTLSVLNSRDDIIFPILTASWLFSFSISLYWSEMRDSAKSTQARTVIT